MKSLEPRRVDIPQALHWFSLSFQLIKRRLFAFASIEVIFFIILLFAIEASASIAPFTPSVLLLTGLFIFVALVLYFALADMVMMSFSADKSHKLRLSEHLYSLLHSQGTLFRMAILALFIGAFYWVISLTMAPDKSVLTGCEALVTSMLEESGLLAVLFEFKLAAAFLYFALLATFSLRIFFSVPLVLFHELDYKAAQALSHKAILLNIVPMSMVLLAWSILLLGSMLLAPPLALLFLPLLGVFTYVAYRSIFLGVEENSTARVHAVHDAHAAV